MKEHLVEIEGQEYYATYTRSGVVFYVDQDGLEQHIELTKCTIKEMTRADYYIISVRSGVSFYNEGKPYSSLLSASYSVNSYKGSNKLEILRVPVDPDEPSMIVKPL